MTDTAKSAKPAKVEHNTVLPSDIDANGNVTLWDSGPQPPVDADGKPLAKDDPRVAAAEAEAKAWHEKYGDGPAPVVMHNSDASHALAVDPDRWSIEPEGMDAEVEAEIKKAQEARAAAKKTAEEREAALELAADRKAAVATVVANRTAKAAADKADKPKKSASAADDTHTYPPPKAKDK